MHSEADGEAFRKVFSDSRSSCKGASRGVNLSRAAVNCFSLRSREPSRRHTEGISLSGFVHVCVLVCVPTFTWWNFHAKVCMLLKHLTFLMSCCHDAALRTAAVVMETDYSLPTQSQHPGKVLWQWWCMHVGLRSVGGRSSPPLSAACRLALSAVVKSYRAVISESPRGLTHPPVPDPAFIFSVAVLSELPRFTSELI